MKVKDILAVKGSHVMTISKETGVIEAMSIFSTNRIGSLLIVDEAKNILGIIGARDVFMAVVNQPDTIKNLKVESIMTTNLIVGTEDDSVDYILAVMTENRIRHIPIMRGRELKGMISIGDVVKALLTEKDVENRYLKDYIADKYPA